MSTNTKTDTTWNPVRGCTKISPGCAHCYAETFAERFRGVPGHPYEQGFDLRLVPEKLTEPFLWPKPQMVFVNSMSDLVHRDVPDEYIVWLPKSWPRRIGAPVFKKLDIPKLHTIVRACCCEKLSIGRKGNLID